MLGRLNCPSMRFKRLNPLHSTFHDVAHELRLARRMKAVVIGGGIAGLAVTSGLQRAGWEILVLERSTSPEPPPSGLSIFGNGFNALDSVGLGKAVREICANCPPYKRSGIRTPPGRWLVKFAPSASENLRAVDRTELHRVLLASLAPDSVEWGRRVSAVITERSNWRTAAASPART
jgi:2-polyprenyl-6-methoxyphenol hydroxylase-like FAD-dependent oxidoreductase